MRMALRRLRGAAGNALVWATAWFAAGFVFVSIQNVLGIGNFRLYTDFSLSNALQYATTMAAVGFVTGGAFSMFVAASYRNNRLENLSSARFALGGGLVSVLLSLVLLGVSPGYGVLLLADLTVPVLLSATLGSLTGYGSIKLAQRAISAEGSSMGELGNGPESFTKLPPNKR